LRIDGRKGAGGLYKQSQTGWAEALWGACKGMSCSPAALGWDHRRERRCPMRHCEQRRLCETKPTEPIEPGVLNKAK